MVEERQRQTDKRADRQTDRQTDANGESEGMGVHARACMSEREW